MEKRPASTLSKTQKSLITKARVLGSGPSRIRLDDSVCSYLIGIVAADLGVSERFPEFPSALPTFYSATDIRELRIPHIDFHHVAARLFDIDRDADTYFSCLANIHARRLKYQHILETQPIPTIDQVGPRGLLQFGSLSAKALTGLMFWRKWIYDIDNRAAQETGYLFEPIIAHAIGGCPFSAARSPVKREDDENKGRQVDCIVDDRAYELKLRMTIAASGQGRWSEELQFPRDCRLSGYTPVLVVLDPTPSDKLTELANAFESQDGEVYTGQHAWRHLTETAGTTMTRFLSNYVREPIDVLLQEAGHDIDDLCLSLSGADIIISIGDERLEIKRKPSQPVDDAEIPEDAADQLPGL